MSAGPYNYSYIFKYIIIGRSTPSLTNFAVVWADTGNMCAGIGSKADSWTRL